jgi:hypothetical protein
MRRDKNVMKNSKNGWRNIKMKFRELLAVIYPDTAILLYNNNNEYLGRWYGTNYIKNWQDNEVIEIGTAGDGTMEIWIRK